MKFLRKIITLVLLIPATVSFGQTINLSNVEIIISPSIKPKVQASAMRILTEETGRRTSLKWYRTESWKNGKKTMVALALSSDTELAGKAVPQRDDKTLPEYRPEGFRVFHDKTENTLWIIGHDSRAVLFGIGELLRKAEMHKHKILIDRSFVVATSPAYPLRGHQIGYRNTANSYDAWSVEQYDQYIRELMLFGTNAIENIPPLEKDVSVHFKVSREEMNKKMSEICDSYDIEYWVWTPIKADLYKPDEYAAELEKHKANLRAVPRLDHIFIPGGDPGHNHPRDVLPFIHDLHEELIKFHPGAGIWLSLQGFSEEQVDYFYQFLKENNPSWLSGVVSGPSSPPIAETRYRLPEKYLHRHYPDITHNVRCDYPVPRFDQAFARTIGREGINPMPVFYAKIHEKYSPFTDGFVSYSDGCHDDVNKIIWSQRGWDPQKDIDEILMEYSRFFMGPQAAKEVTAGILALEKNWDGPLAANGSVATTFAFWQNLEKKYPQYAGNWRWQMLVLRAYYDHYIRERLINEQNLEKQANDILSKAVKTGADKAMENAWKIIEKSATEPIEQGTRQKIEAYCRMLFESIGLQTSVEKYHARSGERGAILDYVDVPLNNRWWLEDQFAEIGKLLAEEEKLARLKRICTWENPGPGSYYDDVSNIAKSPHVKTTVYDATDFAWKDNGFCRWRLSSQTYQNDPVLEYEDLDPNGRYLVRVTGYGDALLRADGQRLKPLVCDKKRDGIKEFLVPRRLVGNGTLRITFDLPEESHLNWRLHSVVSDVWLIKR